MIVTTQNFIYANGIKKLIPGCYGIEYKDGFYYVAAWENDQSVIKKYDENFNSFFSNLHFLAIETISQNVVITD